MYHIVKGRKMKNRKKRAKHTFVMHSFCVLYHSVCVIECTGVLGEVWRREKNYDIDNIDTRTSCI